MDSIINWLISNLDGEKPVLFVLQQTHLDYYRRSALRGKHMLQKPRHYTSLLMAVSGMNEWQRTVSFEGLESEERKGYDAVCSDIAKDLPVLTEESIALSRAGGSTD